MADAASSGSDAHDHTLTVRFRETSQTLGPGDELGFGRAAQLVIDDNPYLHRLVGRFHWVDDGWRVSNEGRHIVIDLSDGQPQPQSVEPGGEVALPEVGQVEFAAGSVVYAISFSTGTAPAPPPGVPVSGVGKAVARYGLSHTEYLALLALSEPRLRNPDGERVLVPADTHGASRLGLPSAHFGEVMRSLTGRLSDAVPAEPADDYRERLVVWAVDQAVVSADDLGLLDRPVTQMSRRV